jgi:hypothetical protein
MCASFYRGNLKKIDQWGALGIDWKVILKWIVNE